MKLLLGLKLGMSQIFDEQGNVIPVTLVEAGPCYVTQIKTKEKDGYEAVQIGFKEKRKLAKPEAGHLKGVEKQLRYLKEVRISGKEMKIGEKVDVSIFEQGSKVKVSGISKGKGFAGIIKRHGFHRKPASHGTKHEERAMGSVGPAYPQRVIKGRKMPGQMGKERVTVKNLKIAKIYPEKNILAIRGAVPGRKGILLEIKE